MPYRSRHSSPAPSCARRIALRLIGAVLVALALPFPPSARADVVPVKAAELRVDEGDVLLSAEFDLALTSTLEEALQKGIPLYFTIEFDLTRARWFWVDEKIAEWSITYRVSYSSLTRQYRVASGPLVILNAVLVVLLMLVVGWQLLRLRRNLKRGVFGSRLALRLVFLFVVVAVLPGALVYAVSVQFLGKSIESWFDVRVDRALEGGLNLGRSSLDYLLKETGNRAAQMALSLSEGGAATVSTRLARAAEQAGVAEAT